MLAGCSEFTNIPLGFRKMPRMSLLADDLLAFEEGLVLWSYSLMSIIPSHAIYDVLHT